MTFKIFTWGFLGRIVSNVWNMGLLVAWTHGISICWRAVLGHGDISRPSVAYSVGWSYSLPVGPSWWHLLFSPKSPGSHIHLNEHSLRHSFSGTSYQQALPSYDLQNVSLTWNIISWSSDVKHCIVLKDCWTSWNYVNQGHAPCWWLGRCWFGSCDMWKLPPGKVMFLGRSSRWSRYPQNFLLMTHACLAC